MSHHSYPDHGRPPWLNSNGGDFRSGSSYLEQGSLFNHAQAHPHRDSTLSESFDTVSYNPPNAHLIAQRPSPVLYAPPYYPPAQQQQTRNPRLDHPLNQQLFEARYHGDSGQTHGASYNRTSPSLSSADLLLPPPSGISGSGTGQGPPYYPAHADLVVPPTSVDLRHGGSYNRALPPSSSEDPSLHPHLDVSGGGMWQGPPYHQSHADLHIPPTSIDLRLPHSAYSSALSQSPSSPAYPTVHSPSRGAAPGPTAATANNHYCPPMAMSNASLDLAISSSRGTAHLPYARVPAASSPVPYDVLPETTERTVMRKRKRADARQVEVLNWTYARTAYPSAEEQKQLARDLDMSPRKVQIWFQNKRQSIRRSERNPVSPPISQVTVTPPALSANIPPVVVHPYGGPAPASFRGSSSYPSGFPLPAMTRVRTGKTPPLPCGRPRRNWPGSRRGY